MKKTVVCVLALLAAARLAAGAESSRIDIAPQPLDRALEAFAEQSGLQVVYVSQIADGERTAGYTGNGTVEEAMTALLAGTRLSWSFTNEKTISLALAEAAGSGAGEPPAGSEDTGDEAAGGEESAEGSEEDETETGEEDAGEGSQDDTSDPSGAGGERAQTPAVEDEITVTAQLRKQTLREVPISVSVLSGEMLDRQGLVSVREIARQTPGFTGSTFNESEPIFAVRGASNTFSQAGTSKPVGVFLDGVYISRNSGSAFDLYDLEQVEILRGPQGTLFGRNVTGGAIVLTTSRPEFGRRRARFDLGFGNFGAVEARGLVGGDLSDQVAGKLSATVRSTDGYGRDRLAGIDQNDLDTVNVRGQLSFLLGESGVLRLTADIAEDENRGRTLSTISPAAADDGDIRTSEHGHPQLYTRDITALNAHLNWTTAAGEVVSITAFRESDTFEDFAFSSASFAFLPRFNPFFPFQQTAINTEKPETFSQELRFVSQPYERFDYVVGLYYFDEQIRRRATTVRLGGRTGDVIRDQTFDQDVDTRSYAAYADVHVRLGKELHLNLGGRFTDDKKRVQVGFENRLFAPANFESPRFEESWSEFTPRLALTWRPSPRLSLFGSYTEGFTSGGFNTEEDTPDVIGRPFDPETLTAYELGIKTASAGARVRVNATLFRQDYEDKQEGFLDTRFNFVIVNAAEATIEGAEVDLDWAISDSCRLTAFYAYLDAKYDRFFIELNADDRSGNLLPNSPEDSFGLTFDSRTRLGAKGELAFNASYSRQDNYFTGSENRDTFLIESYSLVNASISYGPRDGSWRLTAWGKNLGDEEYVLIRSDFGVGGIGEHFGAPRTYGLRLTLDL